MWERIVKWFQDWFLKRLGLGVDDEDGDSLVPGIPADAVPMAEVVFEGGAGRQVAGWKVTKALRKVYDSGMHIVYDTDANEEWPVFEEVSATCWAGPRRSDGKWHVYPHEYMKPGNDKRGIAWKQMYDKDPGWDTFDRREDTLHFMSGLARDARRTVLERTNNVIRKGASS